MTGAIGRGFLLLVGFTHTDTEAQLAWMADKVIGLRLFSDAADKMNLALADVDGAPASSTPRAPRWRSRSTNGSWRCCANAGCARRRESSAR